MRLFFWMGRVTLWVLFLPLGIWRSIVHHGKKNRERQEQLAREAEARQAQLIRELHRNERAAP